MSSGLGLEINMATLLDQARADIEKLRAELEIVNGRRFPVLDDARYSVPWRLVVPFEAQAKKNHDQTLEELARRGGLSSVELIAVIEGHGYHWIMQAKLTEAAARARVAELLDLDTAMQPRAR